VLALAADADSFENIYEVFKAAVESITVKTSLAEGWNNAIHLTLLGTYKPTFFADIPLMSTTLPGKHFEFFYTNLKPIDDNLASTITSYQAINLQGSAMIGHMNNIQKIIDIYQLRQILYTVNS